MAVSSTMYPLSLLCKLILILMGWTIPSEANINKLAAQKRKIAIFSHTSYWDFWLMILYGLAHPEIFDSMYSVVKPQSFKGCMGVQGYILTKLGAIPSTKRESHGEGFVNRTANFLRAKDKFMLLISPKGTICKVNKWKTGYYYLAKELDVPVLVLGFDYSDRRLSILNYHNVNNTSEPHMTRRLINEISEIVPLNPEYAMSDVRVHTSRGVIDATLLMDTIEFAVLLACCGDLGGGVGFLVSMHPVVTLVSHIIKLEFLTMFKSFMRFYIYTRAAPMIMGDISVRYMSTVSLLTLCTLPLIVVERQKRILHAISQVVACVVIIITRLSYTREEYVRLLL